MSENPVTGGIDSTIFHEEVIPFPMAKWVTVLFGMLAITFLILQGLHVAGIRLGSHPAPGWYYSLMAGLFVVLTVIMRNFNALKILVTDHDVQVSYGMFGERIPMEHITASYIDTASTLLRYGGWGLRLGRVKGHWRKVYNVIGYRNVVVRLTGRWFGELVFSAADPEALATLIVGIVGTDK